MYYAGIGSRETPQETLDVFYKIGAYLAQEGWTLRSGGAKGADHYFEIGCDSVKGDKEIYIPWKGFENNPSQLYKSDPKVALEARKIAESIHPNWDRCSEGAKKMHTRNVHQILGKDLNTPTDLVICYTKNGSGSGGTGQALRIAQEHNIVIFDAGSFGSLLEFRKSLYCYLKALKPVMINDFNGLQL